MVKFGWNFSKNPKRFSIASATEYGSYLVVLHSVHCTSLILGFRCSRNVRAGSVRFGSRLPVGPVGLSNIL